MSQHLFDTGQIVCTQGIAALNLPAVKMVELLARHVTGDWGDLPDEDKRANDAAVRNGDRIFSSYVVGEVTIWIITEWNRSVTTYLLPEEY